RSKKSAVEIDADRPLPEVIGHVEEALGVANPGGVDEHIDPPPAIDDGADAPLPFPRACDIEVLIEGVMPGGRQLVCERMSLLRCDIAERDLRAFFCKADCRCPTDARCGARDKRDLSLKPAASCPFLPHGSLLRYV